MRLIVCENDDTKSITEMCLMFAARKSIFVDLLGWNLPVRDERYEVDQFDDTHARYLMIMCGGKHTASTRLLPTTKPHILESLFSHLCKEPVPMGPGVLEITRFCVDRDQPFSRRRTARSLLITALVDFAVTEAVTTYTGVAEAKWFGQFRQFGWSCRALGPLRQNQPTALVPFRIDFDEHTVERMTATGIYAQRAPWRLGTAR